MIIRFTVIRKEGLEVDRLLVIKCKVNPMMNLFNKYDVIDAITRACTRWINKTPTGEAAYRDSSGYFNFGDFDSYLGDFSLDAELQKEGINEIEIDDSMDLEQYVDYDTVLVADEPNAPPIVAYNE